MKGDSYACGYGATRVVEFLLERGADMAEHTGDGYTGTHYAVMSGSVETVKLLLRQSTAGRENHPRPFRAVPRAVVRDTRRRPRCTRANHRGAHRGGCKGSGETSARECDDRRAARTPREPHRFELALDP